MQSSVFNVSTTRTHFPGSLEDINEGDYLSQALNVKMNVEEHNQRGGNHDEKHTGEVSLTKKIEVVKLALDGDKNWYWCHILQNCVRYGVRTTTLKKSPPLDIWLTTFKLVYASDSGIS